MDEKRLKQLQNLPPYKLDELRDKNLLELQKIEREYYQVKQDLNTLKHGLRQELRTQNISDSKIDRFVRDNDEVFNLKTKLISLQKIRNELKTDRELLTSSYWKTRGQ